MGLAEVHSIALFYLTRQADIVFDQTGNLFDAYAYSRFKYGSQHMAKYYASQMGKLIQAKIPALLQQNFWLTSSAYKFVPTASDGLARNLCKNGLGLKKVKIVRSQLFPADYGNLNQAEREAMMQKVEMFFGVEDNTQKPENLLIIDDIRITGAHEQRLIDFANQEGFKRAYFVYIAHLSPKAEPTTEHWLNHMAVRDLRDLWDLWKTEGCLLNARICKFLLSYPKSASLAKFAAALPARLRTQIADGMYKDGYNEMEMYAQNWQIWKNYQEIPLSLPSKI